MTRHGVAPRLADGNGRLYINVWPPVATKVDGPRANTPHGRPSEGTITRALLNKSAPLINSREVEQIESKQFANMTFGSLGAVSGIDAKVGSFAKPRVSAMMKRRCGPDKMQGGELARGSTILPEGQLVFHLQRKTCFWQMVQFNGQLKSHQVARDSGGAFAYRRECRGRSIH